MALFKGETTTWEDVQVRLGNFAERDAPSPSMEDRYVDSMNRAEGIAKQDFVDSLFDDTSRNHEDDDIAAIRRARLAQIVKQNSQICVRRITKESYLDEVTEGSKTAVIVVMMDRKGGDSFMETECRKVASEWITELAPRKGLDSITTRFYVGDIDDLIGPNFPDNFLPFAVVYADGKCQSQLQRATGKGIIDVITSVTKELCCIEDTPQFSPDDDIESRIRREIAARRYTNSSDSEDESDSERHHQRSKGYASLDFERNVLRFK